MMPASSPLEPVIDPVTRKTVPTMLLGAGSLATMAALAHGLGDDLHWSLIVFVRISLTFVLALVAARFMGITPIIFGPRALWYRSIFGTVAIVCNFYALTHLPVTDAMTILKTSPVWVSVIVAILNKKTHANAIWLATAIGFAGVFVMEQPKFDAHLFPILVAVCSAFFIASAQVSMGYLRSIPTMTIVIHFSGSASLTTLILFLLFGNDSGALSGIQTVAPWLAAMALFGTLGQICITSAFRSGNPMLMSLVGLTSIPLAALYDYLFWSRTLGWVEVGGIALIATSIIVCSRETMKSARAARKLND